MSEDANITGKGAEIMLPPQGNPFKADPSSNASNDVQGKAAPVEDGVGAPDGMGGSEEPTDLSPEDIAAMFPATQDERNKVPPPAEVSPAADPPSPLLAAEEAAPAPLTPSEIAAMLADDPDADHHLSARPDMIIHSTGPGRPQPGANRIDLSEFRPDAPVGGTGGYRSKAPIIGKVDLATFDPDAVVADAPADTAPAADAPLGTDAPPVDLAPTSTPDPDLSVPATSATTVIASASPTPNTSAPVASVTITTPAPVVPAPDPFAGLPPTTVDGSSSPLVDTSALAPISAPLPDSNSNQAAVTVSAGGSTVTAAVSAPPAIDDGSPGDDSDNALPSVPPISLPVQEDPSVLDQLVTDKRMSDLWSRIDRIEGLAVQDENSLPMQRTKNFENLKAARNLLLGGRKNYEDALRYVDEVEANLSYIKRVRQWSYSWGTTLFIYNLIWVGVLALGYLWAPRVGDQFAISGLDRQFGIALWVTIVSGGLGGVSKSLFALGSHVVKQDFDVQHRLWYYQSPVIGCIMGIFVFFIAQIGIVAVSAGSSNGASVGYAIYILSWMVGFQQNLALELFEKVKDAILPDEKNK